MANRMGLFSVRNRIYATTATPTRRAERRQNKRSALTGTGLEWDLPRGYYGVRRAMLGLPPRKVHLCNSTHHTGTYSSCCIRTAMACVRMGMLVCTLRSAQHLKLPRQVFSTESRHMYGSLRGEICCQPILDCTKMEEEGVGKVPSNHPSGCGSIYYSTSTSIRTRTPTGNSTIYDAIQWRGI